MQYNMIPTFMVATDFKNVRETVSVTICKKAFEQYLYVFLIITLFKVILMLP